MQENNIPVKVLKDNANFFVEQINLQFNKGICSPKYAESFKLSNITSAFKQDSRNFKDNYKPISILPINKYLSNHFDNIFSKFQCDFRKEFGAQHCLL